MSPTSPRTAPYIVRIARVRFVAFLILVVFVLLANHIMLQALYSQWDAGHWLLRDMFDVDEEENFPTFYSTFALLVSSALLYAIATQKIEQRERFANHWLGLSVAFLFLAVDEVAGMHEALNTVTDFPWTLPAVVLVAILGFVYAKFLLQLPTTTRYGFICAGLLFTGGAIGVEQASAWFGADQDMQSLNYNLFTAVEEGMEMFGVIVFINALLRYMEPTTSVINLPFAVETEPAQLDER